MLRAIAYTREFIIASNEGAVSCGRQVDSIRKYAAEKGIEILAWFTDDTREIDLLKRPGVQALLAFGEPYELVLCERVRALAGSMAALNPFLKELEGRQVRFESAASAWDFVSQQCRRRSRSLPLLPRTYQFSAYSVAKPVRLNFVHLVHHAPPSISPGS